MAMIGRTVSNFVMPAVIGAVAGYVAQKMGYDLSALEGMKQAVMAGLPFAAIYAISDQKTREDVMEEGLKVAANHPCLTTIVGIVLNSASTYLGGLGMEWLSGHDINQGFTATTGGIEGLVAATAVITVGKAKGY